MFRKLKERVWNVLQSWKEKFFSSGGKEILIKAIAHAIPNYTMSCFKITNNICEEINKSCARFWWGSTNEKKKAHWISWKKMSVSKDMGGDGLP